MKGFIVKYIAAILFAFVGAMFLGPLGAVIGLAIYFGVQMLRKK